jgi:hypothetical protein
VDKLKHVLRNGQVLEAHAAEIAQRSEAGNCLRTRSTTASDSRIWPPCAAAMMRAARLTAPPK